MSAGPKRIAMAELRDIFVGLGHQNVRTLLNSGNVLFECARPNGAKLALGIQGAIADRAGFSAAVTVIKATALAAIVHENPLLRIAVDPARHLVAFVAHPRSLASSAPVDARVLDTGTARRDRVRRELACGALPGILDSKLSKALARQAGESITTRNWTTVLKLLAATKASN